MPGTTNFPTALDTGATLDDSKTNTTPQVDNHPPHHNNAARAILALEQKVGVNGSSDATSVDYKLANHVHSAALTTFAPTGDITATNVQSAITQLRALIYGSGGAHPDAAAHDIMGLATDIELEAHRADTSNVHGIVDATILETQAGALAKANAAQAGAQAYANATFPSLASANQANGYARLDAQGVIPAFLLPSGVGGGSVDDHINDDFDAHNADSISIFDTGDNFTADNVEGALAEEANARQAHENDTLLHQGFHELDGPEHTDVDHSTPPQIGDTLVWNGTSWSPGSYSSISGTRIEGPGRTHLDDTDFPSTPADGTFGFVRDSDTGQDFVSWRSEGTWLSVEGA